MTRRQRFVAVLPITLALVGVLTVWAAGAAWSFDEQTRYADSRGFELPWLLPVVIDGLALSLAGVAYAAALDARAAAGARLGTLAAVLASAASNSAWAATRSHGDAGTVALAAGIPVAANLAFEVLLSELRRQVHRRRGLPAPVAIPAPRLLRWVLAPRTAPSEWRATVLALTAPLAPDPEPEPEPDPEPDPEPEPEPAKPVRRARPKRAKGRPPARSLEQLRAELDASILAGQLPPDPSAEAIRKALRVAPDRARQLRDQGVPA